MIYMMVSLDLAKAEGERDDFNKYLADLKWTKLSNVDTVWAFHMAYNSGDFILVQNYITATLLTAAKEFKLEKISYVAQIGDAKAVGGQIVKKNGVYSTPTFNPYVKQPKA